MSGFVRESAEVFLPRQFTGAAMSCLARDLAKYVVEGRWPERVSAALATALDEHDFVALSFAGVGSASSSFVTTSLIPSLRQLGVDGFKRRIRIVESSWQIADVIKRRIALEPVAA
jgi:hypothetical protein